MYNAFKDYISPPNPPSLKMKVKTVTIRSHFWTIQDGESSNRICLTPINNVSRKWSACMNPKHTRRRPIQAKWNHSCFELSDKCVKGGKKTRLTVKPVGEQGEQDVKQVTFHMER